MDYLKLMSEKLDELRAARAEAVTALEATTAPAVDEKRAALTDEEQAAFDEARTALEAIDADIDAAEERVAELEALEERAQKASVAAPNVQTRDRSTSEPVDVRYMRPAELEARAMDRLEANPTGLDSDQLDKVDSLLRARTADCDGSDIARRMVVTENDAYRSAFQKMVTQAQPALTADEGSAIQAFNEYRAASIGTDTSGGFGVPVLIDPTIILTAQGSLNPIRAISRVETITTDVWKGVSSTGVSWSYDAEAAEVSDDTATLAQPSVTTHTARGFIPYSIEVGGDYPGFAAEMSRLLMEGYDELQASAFATGTGSAQPFGIITALDANTNVEVPVDTAGALNAEDIGDVWTSLPDRYKGNATWVMSHDVGDAAQLLSPNGQGSYFTQTLAQGEPGQLKGRPVRYASQFPAGTFNGTGVNGENLIVVGDFRNYLIAERAGMSVELVPHLFGTTNGRPTGQRGWFAWARHGADSVNDLGFRLLQNKT